MTLWTFTLYLSGPSHFITQQTFTLTWSLPLRKRNIDLKLNTFRSQASTRNFIYLQQIRVYPMVDGLILAHMTGLLYFTQLQCSVNGTRILTMMRVVATSIGKCLVIDIVLPYGFIISKSHFSSCFW